MKPTARLQAAIDCFTVLESTAEPADLWLKKYFAARRYIGSKDRRSISGLLYDLLRYRSAVDWHLERLGAPISTRLRVLVAGLRSGQFTYAELLEGCDGSPHTPQALTPEEQDWLNRLADVDDHAMPAATRFGVPDWCLSRLACYITDDGDWDRLLNQPGATDLRVNLLKTNREAMLQSLRAEGIDCTPCPHAPTGIRLAQRMDVHGLEAYKRGLVEIQEESSQLASWLIDAAPGETVIDWCAGAGGKALAMAATMQNQGLLLACDQDAARLARLPERQQRAGVSIIVPQPHGQGRPLPMADIVVVDAPCSGSGTWRRNPWRKWQASAAEVHRYAQLQAEILHQSSRYVRPGGRLFYLTCSLFREENDEQAARFLQNNTDYLQIDAQTLLSRSGIKTIRSSENMLQLLPQKTGTDGFFISCFQKNG